MRSGSRPVILLLFVATAGALALGAGALLSLESERGRLREEERERAREALAARARGLEAEAVAALDAALLAARERALAGGDFTDAEDESDPILAVYDGGGGRIAPDPGRIRRVDEVVAALPSSARLEFDLVRRLRDSGETERALQRLEDLARTGADAMVRGRAAFLRAFGDPDPREATRRLREEAPAAEAAGALATAERWIAALSRIESERGRLDPDGDPAALERLIADFLPEAAGGDPLGAGFFTDLRERFRAAGNAAGATRLGEAIRAAAARRERLAFLPVRLPALPPEAASGPVDFDAGPARAARALAVTDAEGVRLFGLVAATGNRIADAEGRQVVARGARLEAAALAADLGPPFVEARLVANPSAALADPLPWQSLLAVLLIGASLVPLGIGGFLATSAIRKERESVRARSEFLAAVAHQLKTPVANLRLFVETLASGRAETPEERRRMEGILIAESERLDVQLGRVLAMARLDARADASTPPETIDLGAEIADLERRWRRVAEAKAIDFEVARPESLPPLRGDPRGLADALDAVVDNAFQHSPPEGRVRVDCRLDGRTAVIRIADEGKGIAAADRPRLFERFYRGESVRQSGTGTGLGLAIARAGAASAGGTVAVESTSEHGTTFVFRLPEKR